METLWHRLAIDDVEHHQEQRRRRRYVHALPREAARALEACIRVHHCHVVLHQRDVATVLLMDLCRPRPRVGTMDAFLAHAEARLVAQRLQHACHIVRCMRAASLCWSHHAYDDDNNNALRIERIVARLVRCLVGGDGTRAPWRATVAHVELDNAALVAFAQRGARHIAATVAHRRTLVARELAAPPLAVYRRWHMWYSVLATDNEDAASLLRWRVAEACAEALVACVQRFDQPPRNQLFQQTRDPVAFVMQLHDTARQLCSPRLRAYARGLVYRLYVQLQQTAATCLHARSVNNTRLLDVACMQVQIVHLLHARDHQTAVQGTASILRAVTRSGRPVLGDALVRWKRVEHRLLRLGVTPLLQCISHELNAPFALQRCCRCSATQLCTHLCKRCHHLASCIKTTE